VISSRDRTVRGPSRGRGNQSQVLHSPNDLEHALADARAKVEADPDAVPAQWTRYDVLADEVEFW